MARLMATTMPGLDATGGGRRITTAIFLVAFGMLLLEISLTRILSFTIWHHFAYVVLSLAMLGFGASGVLLAIRPGIGTTDPEGTIGRGAVGAAVTTLGALVFVGSVPLDPIRLADSPRELIALAGYVVVGTVPFACAGLSVTVALRECAATVHRLYAWDLLGGALGCAAAVPVMNALSPPQAAAVSAGAFVLAAVSLGGARRRRIVVGLGLGACAVAIALAGKLPFPVAASKHLALAETRWGMERVENVWTALFRTDLLRRTERSTFVRNDEWGLSRVAGWPIQQPWGVLQHDGTAGAPIYDLGEGRLEHLDDHVLKLPYLVAKPRPAVLVIGLGGGRDVIVAKRFGASHVTGVELDASTVHLVRDQLAELHQGLFVGPDVELVAGEGRHFVEHSGAKWDVIQMTGVDTLAATATGAYVLAENYLYTVEAMHAFLDHLTPEGVVSIATGLWDPYQPRSAARMMNVARAALAERGVADPTKHLAVIHSDLLVAEVLVRKRPFTEAELSTLEAEAERLEFLPLVLGGGGDPLWQTMAGPDWPVRQATLDALPYLVEAVRDDKPFFFHFFRWGDLLDAPDRGPTHTTALAQVVLGLLAALLTLAAVVFVVLPLAVLGRRSVRGRPGVGAVITYFLAIGLGFMFFEVSLMQRLVPYLGYPTYAISVVLFALLGFLGVGALLSNRWKDRTMTALLGATLLLGLLALGYAFGLPSLQRATIAAPLPLRVAICVALLAPLGLVLGVFLPLGIRKAAEIHRDVVPWAWATNASASVVATVLSVLIAMEVGFRGVWVVSVVCYVVALGCMWRVVVVARPAS